MDPALSCYREWRRALYTETCRGMLINSVLSVLQLRGGGGGGGGGGGLVSG